MDGRSVYTPLFAGVYWDAIDTPLEDVDRIEVIRGPGGTLWGANAVNGVINIITKSAADTQGTLLSAGVGSETRRQGTARYGSQTPGGVAYRMYAKYRKVDNGYSRSRSYDDNKLGKVGMRADWEMNSRNQLTLQGDYYDGKSGQQLTTAADPAPATVTYSDNTQLKGGNALFRWAHTFSNASDMSFQVYYDHVNRDGPVLQEDRDTWDIDINHHIQWQSRHNILWGIGYRHVSDNTPSTPTFSLDPKARDVNLYTAFIQDEISFFDNRIALTLGSKFEHNAFSGTEYQPNVRIAWTPDNSQTLWGAVSRAVRTPSRGESDVRLRVALPNPAPPVPAFVLGDDDFDSEKLTAYEVGYRFQAKNRWSSDLTAFINKYDDLRTFEPEVFPPPELGFPFANRLKGTTWGVEWAGLFEVNADWGLHASYTYFHSSLDLRNGSIDTISESAEDSSPHHQFNLWSSYDITRTWELDTTLRYVSDIDSPQPGAGQYFELDTRLGWKPASNLELSVAGRNLLEHRHTEFQPDFIQTQPTRVERSVFGQVRWSY